MFKVIFSIFFLIEVIKAKNSAPYDPEYAYKIYRVAAAAYPNTDIPDNKTAIQACLAKSFPEVTTWDVLQTTTVSCGLDFSNDCQVLIAISSTQSTVYIAFRGTLGLSQFWGELKTGYDRTPYPNSKNPDVHVNKYFYGAMIDMWDGGVSKIVLNSTYAKYTFVITGHSLGGALSSLTAYNILNNTNISPSQIKLITFGEPRTGDVNFANELSGQLSYAFRVVHGRDPIPHLPFCAPNLAGGCGPGSAYYQHPQEIWYTGDETTSNDMGTAYRSCSTTEGEDSGCSDELSDLCFIFSGGAWHVNYFGHDIGSFANNSCDESSPSSFIHHPIEYSACNFANTITVNFSLFVVALIALYIKSAK